ncbi:MAG: AbrB/MazE/SpoVT family DNA-binding domain-containing protein [Methanobrevibacter sp.]|jgi:bifunctional DNA-binding transcriptional regulator/antitoxin component of YhaV-PrlF toxin-antitoxin module|nr:AbrB/MazE/SpoVT family DNA-binding domain-containing protein [Candidatus Methanoflexus mossambicus]
MIAVTNIFGKNQTTIPKEIRQKLGLNSNMVIEWDINSNNEAVLKFKKKYSENDCDDFFDKLDKINDDMDQGKKVILDVKSVLKEE